MLLYIAAGNPLGSFTQIRDMLHYFEAMMCVFRRLVKTLPANGQTRDFPHTGPLGYRGLIAGRHHSR